MGALLTGRTVELLVLEDVAAALAVPDVDLIAIDMPIGLSETGRRVCDDDARRLLGRAGSSVFPAPLRQVLGADDYLAACRISIAASMSATKPGKALCWTAAAARCASAGERPELGDRARRRRRRRAVN